MVLAGWWAPLEEGHRGSRCLGSVALQRVGKEGHRGSRFWESVALRRVGRAGGVGTLTVDLHVEGQAGAARRVVGSAAVVTAVGRAQGL